MTTSFDSYHARAAFDAGSSTQTCELHALFEAYLAHLVRTGRDAKTVARNRHSFIRCQCWFDGVGLDPGDATELLAEEYVAWLSANVAETTASRETTHVKAAYRYAARIGLLERNPAANVLSPGVTEVEPEVFSNEELRRIRNAVQDELEQLIFEGLAYGGLRRHELVGLTWSAVDFEQRFMTVRGKGGKLRRVPLHPVLANTLIARASRVADNGFVLGRGGSLRNVNHRLAKLLNRSGVDGGNRPAHRFRKTVATVLYEEGAPTDAIDKIMGWAPTSIRSRYYTRVADRSLLEAMLRLYRSDPI